MGLFASQVEKDLHNRVEEYKKNWDKNGVIQYKDDHIAVLSRSKGMVVEFLIALSDCTKEGYVLRAIDEGKSVGGNTFSAGASSYYYLQKA